MSPQQIEGSGLVRTTAIVLTGKDQYTATMNSAAPIQHFITLITESAGEAPPTEWAQLLAQAIIPGVVTAIIVGGFSLHFNKKLEHQRKTNSEELSKLNADLNKSVQEKLDSDRALRTELLEKQKKSYSEDLLRLGTDLNKSLQKELDSNRALRTELLEHLKKDIQDMLASKARRAEYLKAQITNLYGPLAFMLEQGAGRFQRGRKFAVAGKHLSNPNNKTSNKPLTREDHKSIRTIQNGYLELGQSSTSSAIDLLGAQWGWLDEDDRPLLVNFAAQAEHIAIEEKIPPPPALFDPKISGDKRVEEVRIDYPSILAHIRDRLNQKQRELSGLTEAKESKTATTPTDPDHLPAHLSSSPNTKDSTSSPQ
ncbi:hypothetical protein HMI51_38955 [Corallococcus coralloides]|nr:hypothetical protein [Corallococcus coralloides]